LDSLYCQFSWRLVRGSLLHDVDFDVPVRLATAWTQFQAIAELAAKFLDGLLAGSGARLNFTQIRPPVPRDPPAIGLPRHGAREFHGIAAREALQFPAIAWSARFAAPILPY
jgi:hypothetical protein